ncbi:uncharacterized protein LOC101239151 isoform X1 [Hydra vulgaris]|uniref:uncharacterized protein LOC101239151 isoform X1 n=1 Tax=Hydra vulgaris TaxID=6087 RepID=UPI001F5E876E|nr:uncharacterized protein LOC101239151 [Hydra vulgaris]
MSLENSEHKAVPDDDSDHFSKSDEKKNESLKSLENVAENVVAEVKSEITNISADTQKEVDNLLDTAKDLSDSDKNVIEDKSSSSVLNEVSKAVEDIEIAGKVLSESFVEKGNEALDVSATSVKNTSDSVLDVVQEKIDVTENNLTEVIDDAKKKVEVIEESKNLLTDVKEEIEKKVQDVTNNSKDKSLEAVQKLEKNVVDVTNTAKDKTLEVVESKKESVLTATKHTKETVQASLENCQSKVETLKDDTAKKLANATENLKSVGDHHSTGEFLGKDCINKGGSILNSGLSKQKPTSSAITVIDDKASALYAHNEIRKLHGVKLFKWDSGLAESAKNWALELAESDLGLQHSCLQGYGENIYISKGTSSPVSTSQAVLQWYKTASQYRFHSPSFTLTSGTFTQLVWDESLNLGVGVVFHEEKKTTYIVAHYSPPGNTIDSRLYTKHVKLPRNGELPKAPKLEELIPKNVSTREDQQSKSKVSSLADVLCKWCTQTEEKPIESWSGTQQPIKQDESKN